jgi:hypothetical protein
VLDPVSALKMARFHRLIATLLSLTPWAVACTKTPAAPGLTYLYSLNCTLGPAIEVGAGPHGTRVVIPIVGGTFSGPKLSGMHSSDSP